MADAITPNIALTKPEIGASRDSWGNKTNGDWDIVDGIFKADGSGTSVGLNVGTGKVLNVAGTMTLAAGVIPPAGIADNSLPAAKLAASTTDILFGRATASAGAGEQIPCSAQGRAILAAEDQATVIPIIGAAGLALANIFTATQAVQFTDDSAAAGPVLGLNRISLTPAANDELGRIPFAGRNTAAETLDYAALVAMIIDAADGSEDGALAIETLIAGVLAKRFRVGHGLFAEGVTGGDKGDGTINCKEIYKNGEIVGGAVVAVSASPDITDETSSTVIPDDNTVPQISEGEQVMSVTHTPKKDTNKLRIDVVVTGFTNAADRLVTAALFRDSINAAIRAGVSGISSMVTGSGKFTLAFSHYITAAGTTSAIVFTVRIGLNASGTVHAGGIYAGRAANSIIVTEIAA
jgi:hypothetical protein